MLNAKISIPVIFLVFLTLSILLRKKQALVKLSVCESVISKRVIAYQSLAELSLLDTSCNSNFNSGQDGDKETLTDDDSVNDPTENINNSHDVSKDSVADKTLHNEDCLQKLRDFLKVSKL